MVPGLSGTQLSSLAAATALIEDSTLWVLLVVVEDTADGPALEVLRYNTSGAGSWDSQGPYTLGLQPGWTSVTAGLGYQGNPQHQQQLGENTALYPPYIVITLPDNSQYERQLNASGTDWAAGSSFVLVGKWGPWTSAMQAQVTSGQQIAAVSPVAGTIDLFWVNYSANGGNTVSTATLGVNGGAPGNASQIGTFTTTIRQSGFHNYQTPLVAVARSATHLDLFALGARGGAFQGAPPSATRARTTCTGPGRTPTWPAASGRTSSRSAREATTPRSHCLIQRAATT